MSARHPFVSLIALFALLLLAATSSYANGVRGGSGYGLNSSSCLSDITSNPTGNCQDFTQGTFTIGGNPYNGDLFVYQEPGGTGSGVLDILQIAANSGLTLSLIGSPDTGIFACGSFASPTNVAQDSTGANLTGLYCTQGAASNTGYFDPTQTISRITETPSASGVSFANGTSSPIAVFVTDGGIQGATFTPTGVTATGEPSTLLLLGAGLFGLGLLFFKGR
jgi:hypothetical protein